MDDEEPGIGSWPYTADPPQRYHVNYDLYRARGGTAQPAADAVGFASGGDGGDIARFIAFSLAFDQIGKEGVAGAVAELGVHRGATAQALTTFARRLGRHSYLFDTFTGFDQADLSGLDAGIPFAFADTSLEAVRDFVGTEATTFCAGHFPETTNLLPPDITFCLVHLDCDLYAPMLSGLEFFYPRLEPGGFIVIHDYSSLAWDGVERAVDTFFANKPECVVPMPDGAGSAIVRRQRVTNGFTWQDRLRTAAFGLEWLSAADPAADPLFVEGWSATEDWGRWGVGESHRLLLRQPPGATGEILLEIDTEAALLGPRTDQEVGVFIDGADVDRWSFSMQDNRAERVVRIPAASAKNAVIDVTFRPRSVEPPDALVADAGDDRPLGMAVHRLRARASRRGAAWWGGDRA